MNLSTYNTSHRTRNVALDAEQRRSALLVEATKEFCNYRGKNLRKNSEKYLKLFYALINHTDARNKKKISSILARNHYTPRSVAYYLASEAIEVAAPFLLISPVLWERDLIVLIEKLSAQHLMIIARRSDVNAKIANALVASKDKTVCQVLAKNPVFKLNSLATKPVGELPNSIENPAASERTVLPKNNSPQDELLSLANMSGKLGTSMRQTPDRANTENPIVPPSQRYHANVDKEIQAQSFAERLISLATERKFSIVAQEISNLIELPIENVAKLISHESGESLAIFIKGMGISRTHASQLLLLVNKRASRNIAEFTRSMAQFDRFTVSQCHDIMKNLGAKSLEQIATKPQPDHLSNPVRDAMRERRSQISLSRAPALFGDRRMTG